MPGSKIGIILNLIKIIGKHTFLIVAFSNNGEGQPKIKHDFKEGNWEGLS